MALSRNTMGIAGIIGIVALVGLAGILREYPAFGAQNPLGDAFARPGAVVCASAATGETNAVHVTTARGSRTYTDHCVDANTLVTYDCVNNRPHSTTVDCENGCIDAACSPAPAPGGPGLSLRGKQIARVSIGASRDIDARRYAYPSEIPPRVVLQDGTTREYLLSTSFSTLCRSPGNYLDGAVTLFDCSTVLMEDLMTGVTPDGQGIYDPAPQDLTPWTRSYAGILAAFPSGDKVIGIVHGENQNIERDGRTYLNTVKDAVDPSCVAGYDEHGVWHNCWTQFSSFANLVWWTRDEFLAGMPPHDRGPVLWNGQTYAIDGGGPYHTTGFLDNDALYLYTVVNPPWGWPCLSAARAPLGSDGLPGAFKSLAPDGSFSQRALPSGFTLSGIHNYYHTSVPQPACMFNATYSGTWMSVARLRGTPYYLGLEERYLHDPDTAQIVLRISDDPGNWRDSSPLVLEQAPGGWGTLPHTYPMFSDADATGTGTVDASGFSVIGNQPSAGYALHALPLHVTFDDVVVTPQ